jgi:hypothetical protein
VGREPRPLRRRPNIFTILRALDYAIGRAIDLAFGHTSERPRTYVEPDPDDEPQRDAYADRLARRGVTARTHTAYDDSAPNGYRDDAP